MLSFIDVRLLFVQPNIPLDYLPDGLLQCLQAKDRCIGYAFDFNKTDTQRVGSFWADAFNFRKQRELHGWSFRAVFVLVDDVLTSGATTGACVSALKRAGAAEVVVACFARVLDEALHLS